MPEPWYEREFIIFADESVREGRYFSNFYGGIMVGGSNYEKITKRLNDLKGELNLRGEVKWSKVTDQYLDKYIDFINALFDELDAGKAKIRIMFTANADVPPMDVRRNKEGYFKLYYQFIKHAFGLKNMPINLDGTRIRLQLDRFPTTGTSAAAFRHYLRKVVEMKAFREAKLTLEEQDITEVTSHDHVLLQSLDVVLGSMAFRLNDMHKVKPKGQSRRGKRTVAKEKLYKVINRRIREIRPNFNIGITTGMLEGQQSVFNDPYRHWLFVPRISTFDETKTKRHNSP